MITWTTYGTWLQGDKRGFVKNGETLGENIAIKRDCEKKMTGQAVRLRHREKTIVRDAILEASKRFKQRILTIAVYSNHVHIVCEYVDVPVSVIVGYYKNAGRVALRENGLDGRIWTRGYDKRFCFDGNSLAERIKYVNEHNK